MDITFMYYMYIGVPLIITYGGLVHNQLTIKTIVQLQNSLLIVFNSQQSQLLHD